MNINFAAIKNQLNTAYHFASEKATAAYHTAVEVGGKLLNHTVRVLTPVLERIQQDPRAAVPVVIVSNIAFIEIAGSVINLSNRVFSHFNGEDQDNWSDGVKHFSGFTAVTLFGGTMAGLNTALYKGLRLPLSPLTTAALSAATLTTYIVVVGFFSGKVGKASE